MIYKQCKFRDTALVDNGDEYWLGGIAVIEDFDDAEDFDYRKALQGVICGCCGGFVEADDIVEINYYADWIDIEDCIRGDE